MGPETLAKDLTEMLAPFLPLLLKGGDRKNPDTDQVPAPVMRLWSILASPVRKDRRPGTGQWIAPPCPTNRDARSAFSIEIQRLLAEDDEIKKRIEETIALLGLRLPSKAHENWRESLGRDGMVDRLEMIYLLRTGRTPEEVAKL